MPKHPFINKLNDLSPKEWLKFQKSWFIHNPPPRQKNVLRHPAKFPETLAAEFINFFTKQGEVVFDPMAGTGSTLVAALRTGRSAYGIELNPAYAEISRQVIADERENLGEVTEHLTCKVITGDARQVVSIAAQSNIPLVDYVLTSPPYWDMLHSRGSSTQKIRRSTPDLDVIYSDDPQDLGNINDYDEFIANLSMIYQGMKPLIRQGAYLTIIVKNVKKGGRIYPLAWDLAHSLREDYLLKDEKIWCQDNQRLAPYGLGNAWVSNTFHHYCLQFRKE
ncbi:MAG: site-specific DNA-methyltransferase [Anaerolineales bacterium]|nr:site-specific DNA-methyltransferase [Anaerolineae bacterium]PWB54965.1 MAG: site-specific DNA-methyltransferase [Anaerolineales bacterium]